MIDCPILCLIVCLSFEEQKIQLKYVCFVVFSALPIYTYLVWHLLKDFISIYLFQTDKGIRSFIFESKAYIVSVDATQMTPKSKAILKQVYGTFRDIVEAVLVQFSVVAESVLTTQEDCGNGLQNTIKHLQYDYKVIYRILS